MPAWRGCFQAVLRFARSLTSPRLCECAGVAFEEYAFELGYTQNQVSARFRTLQPEGVIFFTGPDAGYGDFIVLHLAAGRLVFKCELGGGVAAVTSGAAVDDGLWHTVVARRTMVGRITIQVDDGPVEEGFTEGPFATLDIGLDAGGVSFVGGVPEAVVAASGITGEVSAARVL